MPPAAGRIVMAAAQERLSLLLASYCTKGDWPKLHYGAKILLFLLGPQAPAELGWAENPSPRLHQALCSFCPLGFLLSLQPKLPAGRSLAPACSSPATPVAR